MASRRVRRCCDFVVPVNYEEELMTGTTIIACEFEGGVVIGADSRTNVGGRPVSDNMNKLTKITNFIYCCRSGSVADTSAVSKIVAIHLEFYRVETGEEPIVETAAALFRDLCHEYRDHVNVEVIVAGWDKIKGGQVYIIPNGGMCVRQRIALSGSGSEYIYGYADSNFKENMTETECKELIKNAVALAIARDECSGGPIRIGVINARGVTRETYAGPNYTLEDDDV